MRRPAPLEMVGGKSPRQRIWEAIRAERQPAGDRKVFTVGDLESLIGGRGTPFEIPRSTIQEALLGWERAGYLDGQSGNKWTPKRYRLARDVGAEAPRVRRDGSLVTMGLAQEQMWRTLNLVSGDINARELAAHSATAAVPVADLAAADYLRWLFRAGYLVMTVAGQGMGAGGRPSRYRLLPAGRTGPRPPMVCRCRAVYDPNLGRTVWSEAEDGEVADGGQ